MVIIGHSFLVSDLSDSLTSLIFGERPERFKNEGISESFIKKKTYVKHTKNKIFDFFRQTLLSKSLICSFIKSNLSESLTVAHLS